MAKYRLTAMALGAFALAGGMAMAQQSHMAPQPGMAPQQDMTSQQDMGGHSAMSHHPGMAAHATPGDPDMADTRMLVAFPPPLVERTLANMRDHMAALQEINAAIARGDYGAAAKISETRLGMTALERFDSHNTAQFMPPGMQAAGEALHRSASRFAIAIQDADVTGDLKPALGELANTMQACVTCHAGFRLR